MPGVLLKQVEQDPLEGGRVGAVPPLTGLAYFIEPAGLDEREKKRERPIVASNWFAMN